MSGPAANRSAIVAAGILCAAGLINSVAAAPLIPGINGYRRDDASPLAWSRWRGCWTGNGFDDRIDHRWPGRYAALLRRALPILPSLLWWLLRSAICWADRLRRARLGGLLPFTATVRLIPSAEHIWVTTVAGTIVDSSENFARDIQR
jgi:hypothetical protein